jgi:NAD(P)-dependent dehydrogenase (short-subunit alcohol dehydrogenase family)
MRIQEDIVQSKALLVGISDGIGLATTKRLLEGGWNVIGVSSLADELLSAEAPSYHASKAGFSNYLGGLALAMKPKGVHVTNVRFGFVDTKMAKGDVKPFMMSVEKAVELLKTCIRKKPVVYTAPRIAIPLVKFRKFMMRLVG